MKKLILLCALCAALPLGAAQNTPQKPAPQPAAQANAQAAPAPTQQELYKRFQARNKEIRKLTKAYRKASAAQKPVIKARLYQIVSDATDEGIAWSKERIAAQRANLNAWESKLHEQEKNLDHVKAQRVDDILSGEAERRHKLARKRWKKEMKDRKKYMN